jgi:phosphatidylinositol 4-kinase
MLSSSPGSLGFESAPFKLTLEFVEVMGGRNSNVFDYFKTLFRMGFLKARENTKTICALVDMMLPGSH